MICSVASSIRAVSSSVVTKPSAEAAGKESRQARMTVSNKGFTKLATIKPKEITKTSYNISAAGSRYVGSYGYVRLKVASRGLASTYHCNDL